MKLIRALILSLLTSVALPVLASSFVPVLVYHRVSNDFPPSGTVVSTERFREHLDAIRQLGLRTLTVSELARSLETGTTPRNAVVITFDDGRDDNYAAAQVLREHRMRATFYITTGFLDAPGYLTSEQVRSLARLFEIGAHSHTHYTDREDRLDDMSGAELLGEALLSKFHLEKLLGRAVVTYAWPFGYGRLDLVPVLQHAGFKSLAVVAEDGRNHEGISVLTLQRLNVDGRCDAEQLKQLITTGQAVSCQ